MSNFNSLFPFASSLGLGSTPEGACHIMELTTENLLPRDVEAGRLPGEDVVRIFDFGTHQSFSVLSSTGDEIGNARTLHTFTDLANFLHSVYVNPTPSIEEDEALEETLEAIRLQGIAEADGLDEDDNDEYFQDDGESSDDEDLELDDDEDLELDDDEELELDEEGDESSEDAGADIISLVKPKSRKGTKKYKAEIDEMLTVIDEYYGAELEAAELDLATMGEVLDEVFSQVDEFNIDTSCPLLEQVSDYVEFE